MRTTYILLLHESGDGVLEQCEAVLDVVATFALECVVVSSPHLVFRLAKGKMAVNDRY